MDVAVIGAGPAGLVAGVGAQKVGDRTALVNRREVGGMAANDGPIPVRVFARAARLLREARQLDKFGISVSQPVLVYPRLLERMREVVHHVYEQALRREDLKAAGVTIYEQSGTAHLVDTHTIETESGLRLQADKIILSAGGTSRRLPVPGFEWTGTHSDAWSLAASLSGRSPHPGHRGRRRVDVGGNRLPRSGHGGAGKLWDHRVVREDGEWRTNGLFQGRCAG
jgi:pyruvate/2-oxoglutarate dehydrogenase complex dihydrolipoamide dehydrogenase (E3) component